MKEKMVHHQKRYYHHLKKGEVVISGFVEGDDVLARSNGYKRAKPRLFFLLFLSLLSFSLIWASWPLAFPTGFSLYSYEGLSSKAPICSSVSNGTICCDRSSHRTDICFMKGDIRTDSASSSIFLYTSNLQGQKQKTEKIRPYTRKWETSVMATIDELKLTSVNPTEISHKSCDVHHDVPAVFFSTGGYTGNVYHEFNDGIIPLYITSQHYNRRVVFVILEYHTWWVTKYGNILSQLSDFPPIDFSGDKRTHCFKESTVGLMIHDELAVDSTLMEDDQTIRDFRRLLDRAYWPRIRGLIEEEKKNDQQVQAVASKKPKLVIMSRNGSRSITNEDMLVKVAAKIGFRVQVLRPDKFTELAKTYRALNSSDVMLGVHGAAMTHFLFMRPGSVFIQVVPLGTEWAAATYYGEPAVKLGLRYIGYKILPKESSLYGQYDKDDPVLRDPNSVVEKGWEYTKKIYLDNQNVEINLKRLNKRLVRAYNYVTGPGVQSLLAAQ